jgi:anti-sigma B factor antagonist
VEFIDSTGLSVLLNGLRRVNRQRGRMALVCTNPTVLRLFEITRLDATFDIHPSREAALSAVRSAEG